MIHLMTKIRYCICLLPDERSPKIIRFGTLILYIFCFKLSRGCCNEKTAKHKSSAPVFGCGEGEGFGGCAWRCVVPRSNGDPACWRPAWGGVRLRGNDWWERVIFDICAASLRMTQWVGWNVVRNLFGSNVSAVRPPSSVASRHLPPRRGRLFRWCGALCGAPGQWRSRLLAPRLGRGSTARQ